MKMKKIQRFILIQEIQFGAHMPMNFNSLNYHHYDKKDVFDWLASRPRAFVAKIE
jgi:hypothetical protein